ncbi:MAG TPA: EVE domain-containing protein, partial [Paenirhodobacter sp.]
MAKWLFKSEPDVWSWEDQVRKGAVGEEWNGVRNYLARNNMRSMQLGDQGFFYHSNQGKEVVGIVEVCALAHHDSTTDDPRWDCVDIRALRPLACPV